MSTKEKLIEDKIGREKIRDKICHLVDDLGKDQHVCSALNGEWGSGKTFVLEFVEEKLKEHEELKRFQVINLINIIYGFAV